MPRNLLALSFAWLALRLFAAQKVGFGDSEALYACYAMHPALTYRDHPGFVGVFARFVAAFGANPEPINPNALHAVSATIATAVPWLYYLTLRSGARARASASELNDRSATLLFLATPQIAVGLFGFTPDLLLSVFWLGSLALALRALTAKDPDTSLSLSLLLAALAGLAKTSGALLYLAIAIWMLLRFRRTGFRILCVVACALPLLVVYGADLAGGPMFRHRLFAQFMHGDRAGSMARVLGGQLLYVSPLFLFVLYLSARSLWRRVRSAATKLSDEESLFVWVVALPFAILFALACISPFAEPHWLAPPILSLAVYAGRNPPSCTPRFYRAAFAMAFAFSLAAHAWVLIPFTARLEPSDPRQRLAGELFGWPEAIDAVRRELESLARADSIGQNSLAVDVAVVGPYWTVCAQVHAGLGAGVPVGCMSPQGDDFSDWLPMRAWRGRRYLLVVTDDRFPVEIGRSFPEHAVRSKTQVRTFRGGVPARTFTLVLLARTVGT